MPFAVFVLMEDFPAILWHPHHLSPYLYKSACGIGYISEKMCM